MHYELRINIEVMFLYYDFFKLVFHIECFLVPIAAGFLSWALINGKKNWRKYLWTLIFSTGVLIVSFIGVFINSPPEIRASMHDNFIKSISFEE